MQFLVVFLIVFFICIFVQIFTKRNKLNEFSNLDNDGYVVKHQVISDNMIKKIRNHWDKNEFKEIYDLIKNNNNIKEFINDTLPVRQGNVNDNSSYNLMDYIMFLENTTLHTCHRDNNADYFNNINKSYTIILYIDDMKNCLDVIPKSHRNKLGIFPYDFTDTFLCKPGSIILFDSSLIHSGSLDSNDSNRRIQLKVSHKDDLEKLSFYDKYHKIINKKNTNSNISKRIQKHLSCQFPIFSDLTQGTDKSYIDGKLSPATKIFSQLFYSDKNFYKLQDAF